MALAFCHRLPLGLEKAGSSSLTLLGMTTLVFQPVPEARRFSRRPLRASSAISAVKTFSCFAFDGNRASPRGSVRDPLTVSTLSGDSSPRAHTICEHAPNPQVFSAPSARLLRDLCG